MAVNISHLTLDGFYPKYYLSLYADLRRAFGNDVEAATRHYVNHGIKEGRSPSPFFDPPFYLSIHGDLIRNVGANNYRGARWHWLHYGVREGRQGSAAFHVKGYLEHHADLLRHVGAGNYTGAFHHWKRHGNKEGRVTTRDGVRFRVTQDLAGLLDFFDRGSAGNASFFANPPAAARDKGVLFQDAYFALATNRRSPKNRRPQPQVNIDIRIEINVAEIVREIGDAVERIIRASRHPIEPREPRDPVEPREPGTGNSGSSSGGGGGGGVFEPGEGRGNNLENLNAPIDLFPSTSEPPDNSLLAAALDEERLRGGTGSVPDFGDEDPADIADGSAGEFDFF